MVVKNTASRMPKKTPQRVMPPRNHIRPRFIIGAVALVITGAAAFSLSLLLGHQSADAIAAPLTQSEQSISPDSMATVETVDGQALPVREYELFLSQDRAETFAYFQQHYGVADSATFWTTAHGGQSPTGYLKRVALADATTALVQQALATKYGVVPGFTYAGFLTAWQAQNSSRAVAVAAHQVIYGPTSYSESDYFTYICAQMAERLQTALTRKGVIKVTDTALEDYYTAHKSQFVDSGNGAEQQAGPRVAGPSTAATIGAIPFAQAKSVVQQYYVQAAYTALVAQQTKQVPVHVDQSVLAGIMIR
jgi:hypothetical protein